MRGTSKSQTPAENWQRLRSLADSALPNALNLSALLHVSLLKYSPHDPSEASARLTEPKDWLLPQLSQSLHFAQIVLKVYTKVLFKSAFDPICWHTDHLYGGIQDQHRHSYGFTRDIASH